MAATHAIAALPGCMLWGVEAGWGLSTPEGEPGLRQVVGNVIFPQWEEDGQDQGCNNEGDGHT